MTWSASASDQGVIDDLGPVRRLRCRLLRDDRPDELLALDRQLADVDLTATIDRLDWQAGVLRVSMTAGLGFRSSGQPLRFAQPGDDSGGDTGTGRDRVGDPFEVAADPALIRAQLALRSRPSVLEWYVSAVARPFADRVGATITARIDPLHLGAGELPIDAGSWDVHVRLTGLGIEWSAPLRPWGTSAGSGAAMTSIRSPGLGISDGTGFVAACPPALLGDPARVVLAVADPGGLRLEVDPPAAAIASVLRQGPIRVLGDGARLVIALPMVAGPGAASVAVRLVIGAVDGERVLPGRLRPLRGGVVLDAATLDPTLIPAGGRHPLTLRLGTGKDAGDVPLGSALVDRGGRLRVEGLVRVTTAARIGDSLAWSVGRAASPIERVGRRAASLTRRIVRRVRRSIRRRAGNGDMNARRQNP